jgi:hypothetical protein
MVLLTQQLTTAWPGPSILTPTLHINAEFPPLWFSDVTDYLTNTLRKGVAPALGLAAGFAAVRSCHFVVLQVFVLAFLMYVLICIVE